ncbi:MAG: class I SAM-dependent methyltransferase [Lachnospiraceae bacterium]|nr:class I SAM-dependent methyltransferase [Lachnospiraceae bacterium]
MEEFNRYAEYYNAFYKDKDYVGEAKVIQQLLMQYGEGVKSIIDFGCGTGRHDIELERLGYDCTGIDQSEKMIAVARENSQLNNIKVSFSVNDIRQYYSDKKYDAVISMFHVMSYQNTNADVLSALESARRMLDMGGLFIFDAWYGSGCLTDLPEVRIKKAETERSEITRIAIPTMYNQNNTVEVLYEIIAVDKSTGQAECFKESHKMRYFFKPEMEYYLRQRNFELIDCLDCNTNEQPELTSWTCYFIARAR